MAIVLQPNYAPAHANRGNALMALLRLDEAAAVFVRQSRCNQIMSRRTGTMGCVCCSSENSNKVGRPMSGASS